MSTYSTSKHIQTCGNTEKSDKVSRNHTCQLWWWQWWQNKKTLRTSTASRRGAARTAAPPSRCLGSPPPWSRTSSSDRSASAPAPSSEKPRFATPARQTRRLPAASRKLWRGWERGSWCSAASSSTPECARSGPREGGCSEQHAGAPSINSIHREWWVQAPLASWGQRKLCVCWSCVILAYQRWKAYAQAPELSSCSTLPSYRMLLKVLTSHDLCHVLLCICLYVLSWVHKC